MTRSFDELYPPRAMTLDELFAAIQPPLLPVGYDVSRKVLFVGTWRLRLAVEIFREPGYLSSFRDDRFRIHKPIVFPNFYVHVIRDPRITGLQ